MFVCFGLIWLIAKALLHWLSHFSQPMHTAIIGAIALLLVPLVTYFTTRSIETRKAVEQAMRLEKVKLYQDFVTFFMRILMNIEDEKPTTEDTKKFMGQITPRMITYASNNVIKLWGNFRVQTEKLSSTGNPMDMMLPFENILKAMRKDLGHRTLMVQQGDIARLFINDVDKYLKKNKTK